MSVDHDGTRSEPDLPDASSCASASTTPGCVATPDILNDANYPHSGGVVDSDRFVWVLLAGGYEQFIHDPT